MVEELLHPTRIIFLVLPFTQTVRFAVVVKEIRFLANSGVSSFGNNKAAVSSKKVVSSTEAPRSTPVGANGLPDDVKVSEKTNGFLNNIKIEG